MINPEVAFRTPGVGGNVPVVFGTSGPREMLELGRRTLDAMGVPQYPTPEQAARAVCTLVEDALARARRDENRVGAVDCTSAARGTARRASEQEAARGTGCRHAAAARMSRSRGGSRRAPRRSVSRSSKLLDPGVTHKAALGGVHVGITSAADLEVALDAIDRMATRSRARGYLVEAQVADSAELLVGGVRDPVWGPVIAFGRGGRARSATGLSGGSRRWRISMSRSSSPTSIPPSMPRLSRRCSAPSKPCCFPSGDHRGRCEPRAAHPRRERSLSMR